MGKRESLAVPAHAVLRVSIAYLLIAVAVAGIGRIRKECHPIVRKVNDLPVRSIKTGAVGACIVYRSCLCQIVEIFRAAAEILFRGRGIAKCKLPALVQQNTLPQRAESRSGRLRRRPQGLRRLRDLRWLRRLWGLLTEMRRKAIRNRRESQ